jgi:2-oxoglutarate dehydrogenase E2 component (dihydrolipoamide succinyltransferase)
MIDVTVPQLGESVTEGTISKWLVHEGDVVKKGQALASIATDKADSELPAPSGGRVSKILVAEGQTVPVKTLIAQIDESAGASLSAAPGAPASMPPATGPAAGSASSTPASAQSASSASSQAAPPAQPSPSPTAAATATSTQTQTPTPTRGGPMGALATPTVRKVALEHDVDLASVQGTGDRGRVTRDDVMRVAGAAPREGLAPPPAPAEIQPPSTPAARTQQVAQLVNQGGGFVPPIPGVGFGAFKVPAYRPNDGDKVIPFTRRRRITADHMTYSKFASPHVVTVAEVDLHKASKLRDAHKDRYKAEGMSLTILAFVVVATAHALRENLALNARVLEDSYVILRDINVGVAVDSPDGLVVPVVRRADELGVRGIVRAIDDLAKRAKGGKITIDDLSGASFSVSNPGLKGNLFGGAIINQPNVGILRMGEIQKRVVVVESPEGEDRIAIHPVMYVALSYDHRVVDGVAANGFLWRVTELLEKAEFEV